MNDDPLDEILNNPPPIPVVRATTPAKIQKRRENFVVMPMWWIEKLEGCPSGHTMRIAVYLLHLHWKNHGQPFTLANGMLKYDGVSRQSKWRALATLEQLGLIAVDRRSGKSPTIRVHLEQMLHP